MGTVGLNFGSPTSGAGFDVTATVSTIVSNLQKVETPWKTQLSTLQSQDTVISNLGTLLSNLSTDVSQLTDFTGALAQKTGSSSDTGVLELTNATSSAVAGNHTVAVTSLAQTSSGYLTAITSASDTLSGSISIQVGSGKSHSITLNSTNNTLAGLSAAINSAGIGVTASILTDSNGSRLSLVSATSGGNGNLTISSSINDVTNSNAALAYKSTVTGVDAKLTVDGVDLSSASNTASNLIPGVTFQLLAPSALESDGVTHEPIQIVIANDNSGVETAISKMVSDYNALVGAMNTQEGNDSTGNPEPLFGSPTLSLLQQQLMAGVNTQNPNGYVDSIAANTNTTLSGSLSIQVGNGTTENIVIGAAPGTPAANTIYTGSGVNSIDGLAQAINGANIGITAAVVTKNNQSTLTLQSLTAGSAGALEVDSSLTASGDTLLGFTPVAASDSSNASGTLASIKNGSDVLSGSFSIQVGSGTAQTVTLDSSNNTLQGLADVINGTGGIGVTASVSSDGTTLSLLSNTPGSAGNLTVTSNILDTTNLTNTALNYTNSSDISTLANLGITASTSADGTLSFDASVLDTALNSDFSSVLGFFQYANSWGQTFSNMLTHAGTSSTSGTLALAQSSNSNVEKSLNTEIAREDNVIADQQKRLTAELNQANEILQALPSQLNGMSMMYSAISGYNTQKG
jgi:flagellar hook-associated protein 2